MSAATGDGKLALVVARAMTADEAPDQMVKSTAVVMEAVADDWLPRNWEATDIADLVNALTGSRIVLDGDTVWAAFPELGELTVQLCTVFFTPVVFGFSACERVTHANAPRERMSSAELPSSLFAGPGRKSPGFYQALSIIWA